MATIQNFEDIEAWQKARELTKAIYACSGKGAFAKDVNIEHRISNIGVRSTMYEFRSPNQRPETINQRL